MHLRGIHTLYMWGCHQPGITDATFAHLRGIHTLVMYSCRQASITGAAFTHLKGICLLNMKYCRDEQVAAARSLGLPVKVLNPASHGALHWTTDPRE